MSTIATNLASTTTYFVGTHYEVTGTTVTKYYYARFQRITMRKDGVLYYLLGDHLGSTSIVTDVNGVVVSQTKYEAWGEVRATSGSSPTNYTYTGQYSYTTDFGLMFYNARWYDPYLNRFAQADTITPSGVQGLDRYAYVNNSPLNYVDPTGHEPGNHCDRGYCESDYKTPKKPRYAIPNGLNSAGYRAWKNLRDMGLLENTQAALEYIVNTELNSGVIDSVMIEGSQSNYIFQAITNRLQAYCLGGAWSASCLNSFWAYDEDPLTKKEGSDYGPTGNEIIKNIATAVQNPGAIFGTISAKQQLNGCPVGSSNICHYAIPNTELENWLRTSAYPFPDQYNPASWSYNFAGSPQVLYAWNNSDSLFVVMSQAMFEYFNANNPSYLLGNDYYEK